MDDERVFDKVFRKASLLMKSNVSLSIYYILSPIKMKRAVILCLSVVISVALLVKCDDEGSLNANDDEGNDDVDNDFGFSEGKTIETEVDTSEKEVVGDDGAAVALPDDQDEDDDSVKCLVCRAIIEVMHHEVKKINPRRKIQVSSTKSILYSKSDAYLSELMEDLCEFEDTFATIRQVLVQKTFIKAMLKNNGSVEAVPKHSPESFSPDNVNYLCTEIFGANDDAILEQFKKEELPKNIDEIICTDTAKYCDRPEAKDDNDHDEL